MNITQLHIIGTSIREVGYAGITDNARAQLVLGFGDKQQLLDNGIYEALASRYPNAEIVLCSSAGDILGNSIQNDSIVCTVIEFEKSHVKTASVHISDPSECYTQGEALINALGADDLTHILVFSDGLVVNGSQLVKGMQSGNSRHVPITGGLAGDGILFDHTAVGLNGTPAKGNVVAIGFYGAGLEVRYSALGGWDAFGPERLVTKSIGTKIYEIDNQPVVELFKIYLGPYIDDRANSILLFPLSVRLPGYDASLVRSILAIDEAEGCIHFTGDLPEGTTIRFMKANFEKLIDAAGETARRVSMANVGFSPKLTLVVSCFGRKKVLDKRIDEEIDIIAESFGPHSYIAGFYSYGELSPSGFNTSCELHNQTMTITTFDER